MNDLDMMTMSSYLISAREIENQFKSSSESLLFDFTVQDFQSIVSVAVLQTLAHFQLPFVICFAGKGGFERINAIHRGSLMLSRLWDMYD